MIKKNKKGDQLTFIKNMLKFIGLVIIQQLPLMLIMSVNNLPEKFQTKQFVFIYGIIFILVTLIIVKWFFTRYYRYHPEDKNRALTSRNWQWMLLGFVGMIIINAATVPFMQTTGNQNVDGLTALFKYLGVFMVIYALILGPILEELVFRGFIMNHFFIGQRILSPLFSAILFGIVHGYTDPIYFLSKALLGLVLALIYQKTNNLKSDITLHIANNSLIPIILSGLI